ncbi:hypothetical protein K3G63_02625 [Hymenobacter sp. HSC-4F20]|uniref:DUF4097 family beta strand repeat-containing protein n=1 Tax=Hymenobacter sp. HSC-4F20 TaxID=2864135 RepID=UPI001C73C6D6|nr:hypothetical protein [Hymenobacter sp. HSC-4F20]MBX0289313.1 hypothetical protein [Hymenobacter sp. HSC-4F20]
MKFTLLLRLTVLLLWLPSCSLYAQDRQATETINREFALPANAGRGTLALYNIFGSVTVQGYRGNTVVVEITKTVTAPTAELLAQGQKEAQPGFEQRADSVLLYVAGPQDSRPNRGNWHSQERRRYSYQFDYTVKVPAGMGVRVSTVNGGKVLVEDVTGPLQARNVNGPVTILNAHQATLAHTVNGDVTVSYAAAPTLASSYHTINGNIVVSYPATVSADLYFKRMQGEIYTDFPQAEVLPARVTQNQQRDGQSTKYKLSKETAVRLGKGGTDFRFETLNGNVTIKQQPR